MGSFYNQFVNFIQTLSPLWYITIWLVVFAGILMLVVRFFSIYNGTQKKFEKLSLLVLAILLFIALIYLTYIRK